MAADAAYPHPVKDWGFAAGFLIKTLYAIEINGSGKNSFISTNGKRLVKIGESSFGIKRPSDLVIKYQSFNQITANIILAEKDLSINKSIRATDGNIRSYLVNIYSDINQVMQDDMLRVTGIHISEKAADGHTECLAFPESCTDNDIELFIDEVIDYYQYHKDEATGTISKNNIISYDPKHLVNLPLCDQVHDFIVNRQENGLKESIPKGNAMG